MNSKFESIADGLADKGYAVTDQFLSQKEVDEILSLDYFRGDLSDAFRKAGIGKNEGRQIAEAIRGDYIRWLDREAEGGALRAYIDRIHELLQSLNRALYLSLKDFEVHLAVYPAGTFYKRHLDQFRKDDRRKISVICYLNPEWTEQHGGALRMYPGEEILDILPVAGRMVCFRSDMIEHEVLPATRDRYSITGWILDQYVDIPNK